MTYPNNLPARYRPHWRAPWRLYARKSLGFRRWLKKNGYLSPNFRKAEARCKDGTPVPESLEKRCRDHAFQLERLRKRLGRPIPILSWYRHAAYNRAIGGARYSQHVNAVATDIPVQFVRKVGTKTFDYHANIVFKSGGFGQYPAGSRHVDTRGFRARWTSF